MGISELFLFASYRPTTLKITHEIALKVQRSFDS